MRESKKMGLYTLIGGIGGMAAYSLVGLVILMKEEFSSYLVYNLLLGSLFGIMIGAGLGSAEGIVHGNKKKIISGLFWGALTGMLGGLVGVFLGQSILMELVGLSKTQGTLISLLFYSLSWMIMGMFVSLGEGIRSKSGRKLLYGLLGGAVGGLLGGILMEWLTSSFLGLLFLGSSITFFYAVFEKNFSKGVLRVLNGPMKGKKLALNQKTLTIGQGDGNDFALRNYEDIIEKCHAVLHVKPDGVQIEPFSHRYAVYVNDETVQKSKLRYEDVIRIGSARFLYEVK